MADFDWGKYEEVKPETGGFDWSKHEIAPGTKNVADETAGLNLRGKSFSDATKELLGAATSVPKLLEAGADAVLSKNPNDTLSNNLDRFYKKDPIYFPGDASAERLAKSPTMQALLKTAMDVGFDPMTYGPAVAKAGKPAVSLMEQAAAAAEAKGQTASPTIAAIGKLANFFTGGRMGDKWASSAQKFSPTEQIFAGNTLKNASQTYAPMKEAAEDFMSKRLTPNAQDLFDPVKRFESAPLQSGGPGGNAIAKMGQSTAENPTFQNFDEAVQHLEDAVNKVGRMEGANPPRLQLLVDRAKDIQKRGVTAGPETAELMDAINGLEYTGFGNPRLTRSIMKPAQAQMRGALSDLTESSSPLYSEARQNVSDALNMTAPPTGGKMSRYVLQNIPTVAGGVRAIEQGVHGDFKGATETAIATLLLRNPAAWNVVVGAGRMPPNIISQGVDAVGTFLAEHPDTLNLAKQALIQAPKADFGKTKEAITNPGPPNVEETLKDPVKSQSLGKFAPVLQQAAQRGPQALSATTHVLNQTSEEYRQKMRELNGAQSPEQ